MKAAAALARSRVVRVGSPAELSLNAEGADLPGRLAEAPERPVAGPRRCDWPHHQRPHASQECSDLADHMRLGLMAAEQLHGLSVAGGSGDEAPAP